MSKIDGGVVVKYRISEIAAHDPMRLLFPFVAIVGIGGWLLRHDDWWFLAWWAGSCLLWLAWMAYGYWAEGKITQKPVDNSPSP